MASCSSWISFALIDSEMLRPLRSTSGEFRLHFLADLQQQPSVLDAVARQFRGAQLTVDSVAQIDDRALRVHFPHHAA